MIFSRWLNKQESPLVRLFFAPLSPSRHLRFVRLRRLGRFVHPHRAICWEASAVITRTNRRRWTTGRNVRPCSILRQPNSAWKTRMAVLQLVQWAHVHPSRTIDKADDPSETRATRRRVSPRHVKKTLFFSSNRLSHPRPPPFRLDEYKFGGYGRGDQRISWTEWHCFSVRWHDLRRWHELQSSEIVRSRSPWLHPEIWSSRNSTWSIALPVPYRHSTWSRFSKTRGPIFCSTGEFWISVGDGSTLAPPDDPNLRS